MSKHIYIHKIYKEAKPFIQIEKSIHRHLYQKHNDSEEAYKLFDPWLEDVFIDIQNYTMEIVSYFGKDRVFMENFFDTLKGLREEGSEIKLSKNNLIEIINNTNYKSNVLDFIVKDKDLGITYDIYISYV